MRNADGSKAEQVQSDLKTKQTPRRLRRFHWGGSKGGHCRRKTGQPDWFRAMKFEGQRRRMLSKLPVSELAKHGICSVKQANNLQEAGFTTVWAVVSAKYDELLRVPTFGPKSLAKLWQDAKIKGRLSMNWNPNGG